MTYATTTNLRAYLPQVATGTTNDALLQAALDRAEGIIDEALGFSFAAYGSSTSTKDIQAPGNVGHWLDLPYYKASSLTAVSLISGRGLTGESTTAITEYEEESDQRLYYAYGWTPGAWYRVTAIWGYGAAPNSIVEVELELAVNIWRGKDRGMFSDVIGAEGGGAVGYARALTNQQKMILDNVRSKYLGLVHG
jgi:hypothetical protein